LVSAARIGWAVAKTTKRPSALIEGFEAPRRRKLLFSSSKRSPSATFSSARVSRLNLKTPPARYFPAGSGSSSPKKLRARVWMAT
jgi:hypothetical protein